MRLRVAGEAAMEALGRALGRAARPGTVIFLHGDLGAGKTTLSRGFLRGRGHPGAVKSPTYTLVEPYALPAGPCYHFDLYRLGDPEELELIGARDYFAPDALCLVEWPERGGDRLPPPDVEVRIGHGDGWREVDLLGHTPRGRALIGRLPEIDHVQRPG